MKKFSIIVIMSLVISGMLLGFEVGNENVSAQYIPHVPISIDGNADFGSQASSESWPGDGSEWNPYIIEGYDINASTARGIDIRNTNVYFVIRDCYVHDGEMSNEGIYLSHVSNGKIEESKISNNLYGIFFESFWGSSSNFTIINNNASSNHFCSFWIDMVSNTTIKGNNASMNDASGIIFIESNFNNIVGNNFSNNDCGLQLYGSSNNTISGNNISDNLEGINLTSSSHNRIYHNDFIDNGDQAWDDMDNNFWNDTYPSGGNYWSDYSPTCDDLYDGATTPQTTGAPDGIGDVQYDIDADSIDYYPLKNPWNLPTPSDSTPPAAITDSATSNPTTDSITLTWTAPGDDDDSGTATGYMVKYSTSAPIIEANWTSATTYGQSWVPLSAGNTEDYVISGLSSGTKYWFAIKAYDEVPNYADISNSPSDVTISDATTPGAPTGLIATVGDSYVNLTWNAPSSDGGSPIINYTIYRGTTSGGESHLQTIGNVTYYNDTSVTNDQAYYYKVSANNSKGEGTLSDETSATPGTGISLNPPSLIDPGIEDDDGIYYVNWSSVASATGYILEEGDNSGFTSPSEVYSGSERSYHASGKGDGTYYYRVKATASGLECDWSNVESILVNVKDEDEDGLPDSWEQNHFGNLDQEPGGDYDGDGYSNLEEYQAGSDPTEPLTIPTDIDGDGLPDSWEQDFFGNLDQGPEDDYDGDGHTNYNEYMQDTSPTDANDPPVETDSEEEQDWTWIVIIIVIVVIVIGIVIGYFMFWRGKKQPPLQT